MLREISLAKCASGKYCDGASRERKRKKALKFSVSNKGELFYRQNRKGKASTFRMYISIAICELTIHN